eukprot:436466-Prymnesium_polylepis.2
MRAWPTVAGSPRCISGTRSTVRDAAVMRRRPLALCGSQQLPPTFRAETKQINWDGHARAVGVGCCSLVGGLDRGSR